MNKAVFQHYEQLLAEHYSWMFGVPFRTKVDEQLDAFKTLDVEPGKHGVAVDLGSGPGFQSIALAELGFKTVIAIDSSPKLLAELNSHKGSLPIRTEIADLREFDKLVSQGSAEVIVCMGDTLTHLDSPEDVEAIFEKARDCLRASGILVLTFRSIRR
jgi:2-polyprenyl-3-methyl-5-hydroxy-6-metoxy-1,4-benzoquinol methylase